MLIGRKLDRLIYVKSLDFKYITQILLQHNNNNFSKTFIRDYVPLILYGNPHIKFINQLNPNNQFIQIIQDNGVIRKLNLKLYLYPQQLLQRIFSIQF